MPKIRKGGVEYDLPDATAQRLVSEEGYEYVDGGVATVEPLTGAAVVEPRELVEAGLSNRPESPTEAALRDEAGRREEKYGTLSGKVGTLLRAGASSGSFGLSDLMERLIRGEDAAIEARESAATNPEWDTAGTALGIVAPALASGGTGLLGSAARATPVGKISAQALKMGGIKGAAYEGAMVAGLDTLGEAARGNADLDAELIQSALGNAVAGAFTGGGIVVTGRTVKAATKGAREAVKKVALKASSKADDLAGKSVQELRDLKTKALVTEQQGILDDVKQYVDNTKYQYRIGGSETRDMLAASGVGKKSGELVKGLKTPKTFVGKKLTRVLEPLEKEGIALKRIAAQKDDILASLQKKDDEILKAVKPNAEGKYLLKDDVARAYGQLYDVKINSDVAKAGKKVSAQKAQEFIADVQAGKLQQLKREALDQIPAQIERNEALYNRIDTLLSGGTESISSVNDAIKAAEAGRDLAGNIVDKAADLVGLGGVTRKVTQMLARSFKATAEEGTSRAAAALDKFMDVAGKADRVAVPAAAKLLASVSYGGAEEDPIDKVYKPQSKSKLANAYNDRAREIKSQVTNVGGVHKVTPAARARIADELIGISAVSPAFASKLEALATRKLEFLADKMPKPPAAKHFQAGPASWTPSDMSMRTFARYAAALEDPMGVYERLASGDITPEDAEALREVYPEMWAKMKMDIINRIPELRAQLPYQKRLAMSIYTGVPVDAAMVPETFQRLQSSFESEPESEGGTQAPTPQPQFGSVSIPEPTQAQERAK